MYYGEDEEDPFQAHQSEGLYSSKKTRNDFIKKVYSIMSVQLLITALAVVATLSSYQLAYFQLTQLWLLITLFVISLAVEIAIVCFKNVSREVPKNYICLGVFTLCFAYIVSTACAQYGFIWQSYNPNSGKPAIPNLEGRQIVILAAFMTFALTAALTVYAYTTKEDFTTYGGVMFVLGFALFLFGILAIAMSSMILYILYLVLCIIVYGIYLVIDTQLILGDRKYSLSYEDYIIGAMLLYIDIVVLFLKILELLGIASDSRK